MAGIQQEDPVGSRFKKRGWKCSIVCNLCRGHETTDHIFFYCIMAKFIWGCWSQIFGLNHIPRSVDTLFCDWGTPNLHMSQSFCLFMTAGLIWSLWCNRNKMVIENIFPSSPKNDLIWLYFFFAEVGLAAQAKGPREVGEGFGYHEEVAA